MRIDDPPGRRVCLTFVRNLVNFSSLRDGVTPRCDYRHIKRKCAAIKDY